MKWFKHEANARNDIKIRTLINQHGIEAYGVYFIMLELIAEYATEKNMSEWGFVDKFYKVPTLAAEAHVSPDKLKAILQTCNELDLFQEKSKRLFCRQILDRLDEYATKVKRRKEKTKGAKKEAAEEKKEEVPTVSGQTPAREEENREEKIREETPVASNGPKSSQKQNGLKEYTDDPIVELCRTAQGLEKRFVNYGKQINHLKRIREEYPDDEDTKFVIEQMSEEKYWKDNPFDMADVANNMHKYLNRTVYYDQKGGVIPNKKW